MFRPILKLKKDWCYARLIADKHTKTQDNNSFAGHYIVVSQPQINFVLLQAGAE